MTFPVLVTGADGFAGRWLCRHLIARERSVVGWVRKYPSEPIEGVDYRAVDVAVESDCRRAMDGIQLSGVIHLAAVTNLREAAEDPARAEAVNVGGTRNVLSAVRRTTPAVLASTCHVYDVAGALPLTERSAVGPKGVYAESKLRAERAAMQVHPRTVIARAFHHTGPDQHPRYALAEWAAAIAGGAREVSTGDLSLRRDYSDVRDVVAGYEMLLGGPQGTVVNLCSGEAPTLEHLFDRLASASGAVPRPHQSRFRTGDPREIRGDPGLAYSLGWKRRYPITQTMSDLLSSAIRRGHP